MALLLRQIGGGPGADPANAVPRFLIPAAFWATLLLVALRRAGRSRRDRVMVIAGAFFLARELFMFAMEYGSHRGLFAFGRVLEFYPPLEHALQLGSEVVAGYAFLFAFRGEARLAPRFLTAGLGVTAAVYAITGPAWAAFVRAGVSPVHGAARVEFAQHWGDLLFRLVAVLLLAVVVVALLGAAGRGGPARLAALAFGVLLLDHALMVVAIAGELRLAWFL
jgi:hypothetical protein